MNNLSLLGLLNLGYVRSLRYVSGTIILHNVNRPVEKDYSFYNDVIILDIGCPGVGPQNSMTYQIKGKILLYQIQ